MTWALDQLFGLLGLGLLLVFSIAFVSPFEALGWWAGWSRRQLEPDRPGERTGPMPDAKTDAEHYIVYLTGVGGFSGEFLARREIGFLERLAARLPGAVIVRDVFPFSVTNNPLNGERALAWLWQWLHNMRLKVPNNVFDLLIVLRNMFQATVSADPRYGPIYNVGVAQEIVKSLLRHGYPAGSGKPITLVCYSGGGQISVGTARYLNKALQAPIRVVSVGGVISDDPGIAHVEHLYHLQGSRDILPLIGAVLYPGRWPLLAYSPWNQARRRGRITVIDPGPMYHIGRRDYFSRSAHLPNGQSHAERTAEIVAGVIAGSFAKALSPRPRGRHSQEHCAGSDGPLHGTPPRRGLGAGTCDFCSNAFGDSSEQDHRLA